MKWYFACNDRSPDFFPLIKGAVESALKNTTLQPHFIYDGVENELTQWLKQRGVRIINHRISFYNALEKYYDEASLAIASGAFLRCDIPIIETEDEFVLYTDCDVLFLKNFELDLKPKYFACSTQFTKRNFTDFNTGVMVMNVKKLRESHNKFIEFIVENLNLLSTFDQTAYQIFYGNKNTKLPTIYNHKPYWGIDNNAVILHFHGAKPTTFIDEEKLKTLSYIYNKLYRKNPEAYDFYLELFKKYYPEMEYNYSAIDKLKKGIYPSIKQKRTPLLARIKSKLIKIYNKTAQNDKIWYNANNKKRQEN